MCNFQRVNGLQHKVIFNDRRDEFNSVKVVSSLLPSRRRIKRVFMTRCWKNKALFMAMNCQIIRLDFYGTGLTRFESINERARRVEKRALMSFGQSLIPVSGVSLSRVA